MPRNFVDKSIWNAPFAVNNVNATSLGEISPYFATLGSPGQITYGSQDDGGKRLALTLSEIANYTYTTNGTLYEGVYEPVQVDANATAANIYTGACAYYLFSNTSSSWVVTDSAHATSVAIPAGTFLNAVTPGNWTMIFVGGGRVNVKYTASLTNGSPAIGDIIVTNGATAGSYDDQTSTTAIVANAFGIATVAPASAGLTACFVKDIITRI
jgi:hypothetical protein